MTHEGEGLGYPEDGAQIAQEASKGPVTPPDGGSGVSVALSGPESASAVVNDTGVSHPDVRLLHRSLPWRDVAAIWSEAAGYWELTNGQVLFADNMPATAQRMVPVDPLLEVIAELSIRQAECLRDGNEDATVAYTFAARRLSILLASLLPESPRPGGVS